MPIFCQLRECCVNPKSIGTYVKKLGFYEKSLLGTLEIDAETGKETGFLCKKVAWKTTDLRRNKGDGFDLRQWLRCVTRNAYAPYI